LIESISSPNGKVRDSFHPKVARRLAFSPEQLGLITTGLYGVVNDPTGTAYDELAESSLSIAGKTGTAQVSHRPGREGASSRAPVQRDHAWFAGFAPIEKPELVIVVLVEHGGGGGKTAAPIALQVLREHYGQALVLGPRKKR